MVRYRRELERLRDKQAGAAVSSARLDRGVRDLEQRYRAAKRDLKSYGVRVEDAAREHRPEPTRRSCPRIADVLGKAQFRFAFRDFGQLGESFKRPRPAR